MTSIMSFSKIIDSVKKSWKQFNNKKVVPESAIPPSKRNNKKDVKKPTNRQSSTVHKSKKQHKKHPMITRKSSVKPDTEREYDGVIGRHNSKTKPIRRGSTKVERHVRPNGKVTIIRIPQYW